MPIYLTGRHYISQMKSADFFYNLPDRLQSFDELKKKQIVLSMFVSANMKNLSEEIREKTFHALKKFEKLEIPIRFSDIGLTAGQKLVSCLFDDKMQKKAIYGLFDVDQFILKDSIHIEAIKSIAEDLEKKNSLLGIGARDVPVVLGFNEEASTFRIIHELVHSMIPEGRKFKTLPERQIGADVFYAEIGESAPGFYLINPNNSDYERLKKEILSLHNLYVSLPGFVIEYFIPLWSAINSSIVTKYLYSTSNIQWIEPPLNEEILKTYGFIKKSTAQLLTTSVGPYMRKRLFDAELIKTLEKFFSIQEINKVLDIMKSSS